MASAPNERLDRRHHPQHPSTLPGRFPGRPVVPGAVTLDHVIAAWHRFRLLELAIIDPRKSILPHMNTNERI